MPNVRTVNLTQLQVEDSLAAVRGFLGKEILLHPTADGTERDLTAEISGDYAGLFRLGTGEKKFGGGQPIPDLFCPTIRVPLRAARAEFVRANAKK